MDETPFEPAPPFHPWDEEERLGATKGRIRQLRTRKAAATGAAAALAIAVVLAVTLTGTSSGAHPVGVLGQPGTTDLPAGVDTTTTSTSTTTSTTVPAPATTTITTPPPPDTSTTTVAPTTTTTTAPTAITGTVFGPTGAPLAGAYVEGFKGGSVQTDSQGHYSIPCNTGVLLGGSWAVPFGSASGGWASTASEATPGPGYIFSGGATGVSAAITPKCGSTTDFHLPAGSGVTIHFTNSMPSGDRGPADNLYLPGLGDSSEFLDPPLDADNNQVVDQLGSGSLRIDGVATDFDCSGPGVSGSGPIWYVALSAGQTPTVYCSFVSGSN